MTQQEQLRRLKLHAQRKIAVSEKKCTDYANTSDPFANFTLIEVLTQGRISTAAGILTRLTDKLQRIASLLSRPPAVVAESLEDTILDLANYGDLLYLWVTRFNDEMWVEGTEEVPKVEPPPIPEAGMTPISANHTYEALAYRVETEGAGSLSPIERMLFVGMLQEKLKDMQPPEAE